jgi:hypothetical protein
MTIRSYGFPELVRLLSKTQSLYELVKLITNDSTAGTSDGHRRKEFRIFQYVTSKLKTAKTIIIKIITIPIGCDDCDISQQ